MASFLAKLFGGNNRNNQPTPEIATSNSPASSVVRKKGS